MMLFNEKLTLWWMAIAPNFGALCGGFVLMLEATLTVASVLLLLWGNGNWAQPWRHPKRLCYTFEILTVSRVLPVDEPKSRTPKLFDLDLWLAAQQTMHEQMAAAAQRWALRLRLWKN